MFDSLRAYAPFQHGRWKASVPFWYTAIPIFIWDRDMGFRKNTVGYWVVIWGMFPAYGIVAYASCFVRLLK